MASSDLKQQDIVEIFSDGACRGNPGIGGWGVILRYRDQQKELKGATWETTNNRMELTAAIEGLTALKKPSRVAVTTDSQYVRQGITEWLPLWQRNGWKTRQKKAVKNQDLWEQLAALVVRHQVEWHWVRGHSGHPENERADALANQAIDELKRKKAASS